ncbi:N-acetyl-gamma-glutamyl-phosphate reductase [Lactobacillus sp. CC-MHH1034]|uniref:N-acetyl-gamma-glutamyl-phosphate reductase n=1 Tax=Agrilactobacillus fermenti TaxID=2586909 RepID=UPI001E4512D3|nr:N-acetyl-gamma-glutamyl-phosphate reductase [Agrilactobacillus fermenti]MCD2256931.1 N-acetyl-gamma-glutamyl-phosphate reductase [Agrilactobacillus fermenti]
MQVAIIGVTGYAGKILYQLLSHHPYVSNINLYGHEDGTLHQYLLDPSIQEYVSIQPFDAATIMANNDVLFFATPAGVSTKLANPFIEHDFPVIDLSGDYRLQDINQFEKWYQKPAPSPEALLKTNYNLPEFDTPEQTYIANPGCYATATLLGLAPLVQNHLLDNETIIVDAKSGVTGAGKQPKSSNQYVHANENLSLYKINQHQHIPEIIQELQTWDPNLAHIQFSTTLLPVDRGILATIYVKPTAAFQKLLANNADTLKTIYQRVYQTKPFVNVYPPDQMPDLKTVVGTNNCLIGLTYNPITNVIMIVSVIDNLLKGAAGAAVQNFNQLFNFSETSGLPMTNYNL